MEHIFSALIPVFALILIGYFFKEFQNNMKHKVSEKITGFFVILFTYKHHFY